MTPRLAYVPLDYVSVRPEIMRIAEANKNTQIRKQKRPDDIGNDVVRPLRAEE